MAVPSLASKQPSSTSWADVEDSTTTPTTVQEQHPTHEQLPDGSRLITTFHTNAEGKQVKVTRRIRLRLVKTTFNHDIAERKKLTKFGCSRGLPPGPDANSTTLGDIVNLNLTKKSLTLDAAAPAALTEEEERKIKLLSMKSSILCRICKGNHYSMKCPYKDTHVPLDQIGSAAGKEGGEAEKSAEAAGTSTNKYVPPSQRPGARPSGTGETMDGRGRPEDVFTIRINNLSREVTDVDVQELTSKFGRITRVFVSRDRDSGVCRGFAFVTYTEISAAEKAVRVLDGYGYDNLILKCELAKPNAKEGEIPK